MDDTMGETAFGSVGRSVLRIEDQALLVGSARFVDDLDFHGTLHVAFVRSPYAHALVQSIDTQAARALPGVHSVLTLADLRPVLTADRLPLQFPSTLLPADVTPFVLTSSEVTFAGETVAMVLAETRYLAEDAAQLVQVEYEALPAVSDCRTALEAGAPPARLGRRSNVLQTIRQAYGDVDAAFAAAQHTARVSTKQHRGCAHSIEGRGLIATLDTNDDRLTLWSSTQQSHELRASMMKLFGRDENQLRVVAPEVGGGFGAKFIIYAEDAAVAAACLLTRRPVKWVEDRREHFQSAVQERDQYWDLEVAFDKDGRLGAIKGHMIHDNGAFVPQGTNLPYNASTAVPGPYLLPAYRIEVSVVETNKVAVAPVRGAGYPEGAFAMERTLDAIADALDIDRAEVRRRNLVRPEQLPYVTPIKTRAGSPVTLDSGDFPACLDLALGAIDYPGFAARQSKARAAGRHIGIGVGIGTKGTGRGPFESGIVRVGRSGRVSIYTGAMPMGQGIKTALAQICAEQLGIQAEDVTVVAGDTSAIPHGQGGFASRQTITAGSAVHMAAVKVREKALEIAAHLLETSAGDLTMRDGRIEVKGAPGSGISLREVAETMSGVPGYALPAGFEPGLESMQSFIPDALTYGFGCHVAEVEVDIETMGVRILDYVIVNDSGKLINPMIVKGQLIGGAVHGIGNALLEWMVYNEDAQPVSTTLAEYTMATSCEVPSLRVIHTEYPSPLNPLGVKGVGEAGCVPAASAIVSAVESALKPYRITVPEYPMTPTRMFRWMAGARGGPLQG